MATLITGGGSQIGLRLFELLGEAGKPVIFASRSGSRLPAGVPSVKFDWEDPTTFEAPFALGQQIDYVYILAPNTSDPLTPVKPFIDLAVAKGVKRFVLLSGAGAEADVGPKAQHVGKVQTYLHDKGLDYVALRPTWFTENLYRLYGPDIKGKNLIENVVEKGPISFIAVEDIAQTAFKAITDVESLPTREPILVGPERVSYQDVAASFSKALGREIKYNIISIEEKVQQYVQFGRPEQLAHLLVAIEKELDDGSDGRLVADPRALKGKVGVSEWIEKNKALFS
ncbi:ergot alkaloid A [Coprinellus micaceus]|uniref:Ergot alkaloid A n=1 Tax=Coprinellus micaceus TaxID=71717 RepID=A0A4Y7SEN9_COPMI|nr:ergot alkaloid A [Coprinellus micaceus]